MLNVTVTVSNRLLGIAALLLAVIMLLAGLGALPLIQPDEGRNATVAREMKESGSWLVPTLNGLPYLDKPAFFFDCVAISMKILGETEAATRLPSALAGLALLALVYAFCRREFGPRCAALAAIVTVTTPLYFLFARLVIMDMVLTLFVCGSILAGFLAERFEGQRRLRWYLIGTAAAGFGTLVKGPVGFLVPVLVLGVFHAIERRRDVWKRLFSPWNLLVFLAIVLPWFVALSRARPDFPEYGIMKESLGRFATNMHGRSEPFWFYGGVVAVGFLGWSLLIPESAWAAWRARKQWSSAERLCVVWTGVVFVFFSLSHSKQPAYVLSLAVALGILVARVFERAFDPTHGRAARIVHRAGIVLFTLLLAMAIGVAILMAGHAGSHVPSRVGLAHVHTFISRPYPALAGIGFTMVLLAVALWRRQPRLVFAGLAVLPLVMSCSLMQPLQQFAEARSARRLAAQISALPSRVEILCIECFPSSLPFYLKRSIPLVDDNGNELASNYIRYTLSKTQDWPPIILRAEDCKPWLSRRTQSVLLIANRRKKVQAIADEYGLAATEIAPGYWSALIPSPASS